ncbi:hypothetical protein [Streptomyces chartreusis]|uniref:hypothetical protein n=1 Tax=Streptomyces chartreusis TaxID=1969 RepID=UPI00367A7B29
MLIGLSVRRLFCDGPGCGRRTFAEQVEGLTVRYQRRSPLLQQLMEMAGVLLPGRGGARLLQILKVPLSRTSVLFHDRFVGRPVGPVRIARRGPAVERNLVKGIGGPLRDGGERLRAARMAQTARRCFSDHVRSQMMSAARVTVPR